MKPKTLRKIDCLMMGPINAAISENIWWTTVAGPVRWELYNPRRRHIVEETIQAEIVDMTKGRWGKWRMK